jgi:hypothetical protein
VHTLKLFLDSAGQPLRWRLNFAVDYFTGERQWLRNVDRQPGDEGGVRCQQH